MGLYSSWASIVLISVFDWACISFSRGWGSIQEWASICADTVNNLENPPAIYAMFQIKYGSKVALTFYTLKLNIHYFVHEERHYFNISHH